MQDGVNGTVIETKNPDALANAIKTLHADPPGNVRQTVPPSYTLDAMVNRVIGVYEELLSSKP